MAAYILIGDWNPPKVRRDQEEAWAELELPEDQQVGARRYKYHNGSLREAASGVSFQQCGGGRRIIRKRLGGN